MSIFKFGLISALGLSIDILIFSILIIFINTFLSAFISASAGVIFVYFISKYNSIKAFKFGFITWLFYQIFNITIFSSLISIIAKIIDCELCAKFILIPFSFTLNYLVINILLKFKK